MNKIISSQTKTLLTYSLIKGIGPATIKKLIKLENVCEMPLVEVLQIDFIGKKIASIEVVNSAVSGSDNQIELSNKYNGQILSILDDSYPPLLRETPDAPCIIYIRGNLQHFSDKYISVIGTRQPTRHGQIIAERITENCVTNGCSIVSGLALGVDTIAHRTAVNMKSHTIAVMAHGLDIVAPIQNSSLAQEILEAGGALVSQFPYGNQPIPANFVTRDKTQAGLAHGVIMIQSDLQGGSLHASRSALRYNRWLAVPNPTQEDLKLQSPKIQANLVINGQDTEKAKQLLQVSSLENVITLNSKEDYGLFLNKL